MKKKCLQQKGPFTHPGQKGRSLSTTRALSVHVPEMKGRDEEKKRRRDEEMKRRRDEEMKRRRDEETKRRRDEETTKTTKTIKGPEHNLLSCFIN